MAAGIDVADASALAKHLYRPIVFREAERIVQPASWIEHIPFAFWIVEALKPQTFVELGTGAGTSYAAFAQAVQMLGLSTACYAVDTWQGDSQSGFYDESVFDEWLAYHDGHFAAFSRVIRSTFADAAEHFSEGSIDLLHSDGCHTYEAGSADIAAWRAKLSRRGVILIHDINVREGDYGSWKLWEELKAQAPSFEFLHGYGLGVLAVGSELPPPLEWLFGAAQCPAETQIIRQFFANLGSTVSARLRIERLASVERQLGEKHAECERAQRDKRLLEARSRIQETELSRLQNELAEQLRQASGDSQTIESQRRELARLRESAARRDRLSVQLQERLAVQSSLRRKQLEQTQTESIRHGAGKKWTGLRRAIRSLRASARLPRALGMVPSVRGWSPRAAVKFSNPARLRQARAVYASGLFDASFYRRTYPDLLTSRLAPLAHFLLRGAREGRSPHPLFDAAYYLRSYPDVAAGGMDALQHFRTCGAFEGRNPHPLFDTAFYLDQNPDVKRAEIDPLSHFIRFGAADGRSPHPLFDTQYYLQANPDVAESGMNPLVHFLDQGWREGRRPSAAFDTRYYLAKNPDVRKAGENPLVHYVHRGRAEGRRPRSSEDDDRNATADSASLFMPPIEFSVRSLDAPGIAPATVLCVSHVLPLPPRAGNEYRIYRLLCWLRKEGYRIVIVVAPLPGEPVDGNAVQALASEFGNAVVCERNGRLDYVLHDVPDVLASLDGEPPRPISLLLDEDNVRGVHERQLLEMERVFCHDALVTAVLRLHRVLGSCIFLSEYIWMSRVLPLLSDNVLKVIDTIDVFSTKRDKVLQFGVQDLHVAPEEEAKRLRRADVILAIQEQELLELRQLVPDRPVVTAGVDFEVVADSRIPEGRRVLYVASDNPMNRKGLLDFLRFAWPRVRKQVPDAELLVAGRVGDAMDANVPGVERLGRVDDLAPLYGRARVVINPAIAGTGLKIKTLEALGHLRPVITWPNGVDGLPEELTALCITVRDWFEFSRAVSDLLTSQPARMFSPKERNTIARLTSSEAVYHEFGKVLAARSSEPAVVPAGVLRG
jgi:hypothetical protein